MPACRIYRVFGFVRVCPGISPLFCPVPSTPKAGGCLPFPVPSLFSQVDRRAFLGEDNWQESPDLVILKLGGVDLNTGGGTDRPGGEECGKPQGGRIVPVV